MNAVRRWLETIGLGQYADTFEANHIDMDLLRQVDDQMLKDIVVDRQQNLLAIWPVLPGHSRPLYSDLSCFASTSR
jgi:SAM (Sterile alpha motif) domain-containing protein